MLAETSSEAGLVGDDGCRPALRTLAGDPSSTRVFILADDVSAGSQAREGISAIAVGEDVRVSADVLARVIEVDINSPIGDAGFEPILGSVTVGIVVNGARKAAGGLGFAEGTTIAALTGDGGGGPAQAPLDGGISRLGNDADDIGAGRQAREGVGPGAVGGGYRITGCIRAGISQVDIDLPALKACLSGV